MATLNGLPSVATLLPVLSAHPVVVTVFGLLFGAVFLSVLASTTALVRHNLPPASWSVGISMFTIVFAAGQIVGPTVVGWISDGMGTLESGLTFSAGALLLGAWIAARKQPVRN